MLPQSNSAEGNELYRPVVLSALFQMTLNAANWIVVLQGKRGPRYHEGDKILIMIVNRFPGIDLDLGIGWKIALRYGNINDI